MGVISSVHATTQQQRQALQYLMFLKENRTGMIKGRGCADGQPQQKTMKKEVALSCTPSTDSVIIISLRDARERRYVSVTDIPGAFLQCDAEGIVILRIKCSMVHALLKIELRLYREFVVLNNRR